MDNKTLEQKRDALLREYLEDIMDYVHNVCYGKGGQLRPQTIETMDGMQKYELVCQKKTSLRTFYDNAMARFDVFSEAEMFSKEEEAQWQNTIRLAYREGRRAISRRYFKNENWFETFLSADDYMAE